MNSGRGAKEGRDEEPKKIMEEKDLVALLDFPDNAFQEGKLTYVQPETWKNVGASVIHAIKLIKDHQVETADNLTQLMTFVRGFSSKTFSFIKTQEFEMTNLKNKVTRDLT